MKVSRLLLVHVDEVKEGLRGIEWVNFAAEGVTKLCIV
jgi:hypothetical protein